MMKKFKKFFISSVFLLTLLTASSCGKGNTITTINNPSSGTASEQGDYVDANPPSPISQVAFDGVRPRFVMKNTYLRIQTEIGITAYDLFSELESKTPKTPVNMDDMNSYIIYLHQAKISFSSKNMENMMKYIVFNYPNAPLTNVTVTILDGGRVIMKGTLKKLGIPISFEAEGPVTPTPEGLIEITPDKMKAFGIPVKSIMDLFGIDAANVINLNEKKGLKAIGSKFILYPERILTSPTMKGKVTKVETKKDELIIYFNDNTNVQRPPLPIAENTYKNYIHVYGGAVRLMGNETHENTNFMLIDMDQSNIFDFSLPDMLRHAMAAYVHILTTSGALAGYVPDYEDINKRINKMPILDGKNDDLLNQNFVLNPNSDPKKEKQQGTNFN